MGAAQDFPTGWAWSLFVVVESLPAAAVKFGNLSVWLHDPLECFHRSIPDRTFHSSAGGLRISRHSLSRSSRESRGSMQKASSAQLRIGCGLLARHFRNASGRPVKAQIARFSPLLPSTVLQNQARYEGSC